MRKALTIGELLITMAIIGIIAVLVLPGFLKDYHKKLYVAHLKKVYEMLDNAVNQACTDNNVSYFYQTPYGASGNQQDFIDTYFKKSSSSSSSSSSDVFSASYTSLYGSSTSFSVQTSGSGWGKLTGGEEILFYCDWTGMCVFYVDINSTDGPNIMGRDFFTIALDTHTNQLGGEYNSSGDTFDPDNCTASAYGEGCLELIMRDNWSMEY